MQPTSQGRKRLHPDSDQESLPADGNEALDTVDTCNLQVSLPSGRCQAVNVPVSGTVCDLKMAAGRALKQPFLKLAGPDGRLLHLTDTLETAGLKDEDCVTAVAR